MKHLIHVGFTYCTKLFLLPGFFSVLPFILPNHRDSLSLIRWSSFPMCYWMSSNNIISHSLCSNCKRHVSFFSSSSQESELIQRKWLANNFLLLSRMYQFFNRKVLLFIKAWRFLTLLKQYLLGKPSYLSGWILFKWPTGMFIKDTQWKYIE